MGLPTQITSRLLGIAISIAITVLAYFIADLVGFNAVLMALIVGIVIGNIIKLPNASAPGIKFSSGFILELAIALMAFGINYGSLVHLGWQSALLVGLTMTIVLIFTKILAKKLHCPGTTGWLIGFGTAICGSAAIAALAPKVVKDKTDIGIALAVVNLYGLIGMIAIPLITVGILSDLENGILIGASLHAVGNVAGAGFAMSDSIGEMAVAIKLGRVALLTPALLLFGASIKKSNTDGQKKSAKLPWYLIAFLVISITFSIVALPKQFLSSVKTSSNFLLAVAMAAIGLKVGLRSLLTAGKKAFLFGGIVFAIELVVIIVLLQLLF
ncbi:MAG: putative integral membrane protein (TIGR00698 family) [Bacteroidia bacterium]